MIWLATFAAILLPRADAVEVRNPVAHVALASAVVLIVARDTREVRDLGRLARMESRWVPGLTSPTGCCVGLWQTHKRYFGKAPLHCPVAAALAAVRAYRGMRTACRQDWLACWLRGPARAMADRRS